MPAPNSDYWATVRASEDFLALVVHVEQWSRALELQLRQHAGPEWTGEALEKAGQIRQAAVTAKKMVVVDHPYKREDD